jgi:hypothetical protein
MDGPAAHDRIERFMLELALGPGDEPKRLRDAFRAHLATMGLADLPNSEAADRWRSLLADYFDAGPGEMGKIHAGADAMVAWQGELREEFLADVGLLTASVTPPGWRRPVEQ